MEKCILVTGANRGLGLAVVRVLLDSGYRVIAACRQSSEELDSVGAGAGGERLAVENLDISRVGELREQVNDITARHGPLYGLVNNAAIARDGVLATLHEKDIEATILTNVTGTIVLTKYAVRSMLLQGEGRIVNIASIIASTGFNGLSVYGATKASMLGFTKSLARELGRARITVNSVSPGYMETQMSAGLTEAQIAQVRRRSPLGELVGTEDVARAVDFLMGEGGRLVTGTNVTVDAGSSA